MFVIDTGYLTLRLEIVPVEALRLHEEVIPEQANELVLEFRNWANLQNPIIVDEKYMVLDGHHRAFVFKRLGFRHILVCKIDYFNSAVQLRYWFRRLGKMADRGPLTRLIEDMKGAISLLDTADALREALRQNRLQCGIQQGDFFAAVSFHEEIVSDAVSAYRCMEILQERLVQDGKPMDYIPCQTMDDIHFCREMKSDEMVIWTPQITKDMVVDAVNQDKRFAPKATRHLIPARPLNVDIPITLLNEPDSLEEINARLVDFLKKKKMKRFGPGQIVNGRYYEEELYVFFD